MSASALVPSPSSAGASAATPATDARVQLHRHALESIFAYLDLAALAKLMAVSRDWQAAVRSMRCINSHVPIKEGATLQQLVMSRMRRHVTGVNFWRENVLTPKHMALLHERMPHLTCIHSDEFSMADENSTLVWPPHLLELSIIFSRLAAAKVNALLCSIVMLSQLRSLTLSPQCDSTLSFAPLASLPLLRHLCLRWNAGVTKLSSVQADQLRALSDLETMDVEMSAANVMRLLRMPHTLQWKRIPRIKSPDDDVCDLLPGLSCLTELTLVGARCTPFDWLPRMQSLTTLSVGLSGDHPAADAAIHSLIDALQHCPRITLLQLQADHMPITSEQLTACLVSMPALSSLHVWDASLLSLAFLALPSLAQSLRTLSLNWLREPKPAVSELHHLHGLQSLRCLNLCRALATPLDAETQSLYQPHSVLMPALESFDYQHE